MAADYSPPKNGLVGWWRGDGDANDSAGTNHGMLIKGVRFEPGVYGQAFSFSGTANRVFIPDCPQFKLTNSLSMAAWIYPKALSWHVLGRSSRAPNVVAYLMGMDNSGHFWFQINNTWGERQLVQASIEPRKWQHVAAVLDGTNGTMRLYIDGALAAEKHASIRPLTDLDPSDVPGIGLGNDPAVGGFPFIGLIDEVLLYSRALTPKEVETLATGVTNNAPPTDSPPAKRPSRETTVTL